MKRLKTIATTMLLALSTTAFAQQGTKMELWPQGAPNTNGDENDKAELTIYLPNAEKADRKSVV